MCKHRIRYKFTTDLFIEKSKCKHLDKYDYSKTKYINKRTEVIIICPIHGEFSQLPLSHIKSETGCFKCGNILRGNLVRKYKIENIEELKSWRYMIKRCYHTTPKSVTWPYYQGRGITVCERWKDKEKGFQNFLKDMKQKPTKYHSIDRINNDGNYEPGNCRWATNSEQILNSRRAINSNSGIAGITKQKRGKTWKVTLNRDNKEYYGGSFDTIEEAKIGLQILKQKYYENNNNSKWRA